MQYSEEQQKAIDQLKGNLKIIACAGSGKTEVISRRVAMLIKEGVPASNIVCFTFTEKAADEMRSRIFQHLEELCPKEPIGEMFVGTMHSFCFYLLRNHNPLYANYEVLDENFRIALLSNPDYYHRVGLENLQAGKSKFDTIIKFCESVDIIREECLEPSALKNEKYLHFSYKKYEDLLNDLRLIDFSGILSRCLRMLENADILRSLQEKYRFVVIDEYQDINKIQERIIQKIWGSSGNICIVGDDDQSIYHWRGSDVSNILTFEQRYPSTSIHVLSDNFRSTVELVSSANVIIHKNSKRITKKMNSTRPEDKNDIVVNVFRTCEEEGALIAKMILELVGTRIVQPDGSSKTMTFGDFAVLFRSVRNSASYLIKELQKKNIPFYVKGTADLFECPEVDLIAKCFAFMAGLKYQQKEIQKNDIVEAYVAAFGENGALRFAKDIEALKAQLYNTKRLNIQKIFHAIVGLIGSAKLRSSVLWNLGHFSQLISDFEDAFFPLRPESLKFFLGFIEGYATGAYESGSGEDPTLLDAVLVSTIHRAKGLEFGCVFVPSMIHGIFPPSRRMPENFLPPAVYPVERYRGDIEDERRLFYVALTRSKKYLFVSFPLFRNNVQRKPSQFFEEFQNAVSSKPSKLEVIASSTGRMSRVAPKYIGMSFSEISCFLRCPYEFELRHVYGFNPGIDEAIGFGKQIHFLLNFLHKNFMSQNFSLKVIPTLVERMFFLRYSTGKPFENMKKKALKIILDYVKGYASEFDKIMFAEKQFEYPISGLRLVGVADLIAKANDGRIMVVDFKTEQEQVGTPIELHELQLRTYALAIAGAFGLDVSEAYVHFLQSGNRTFVSLDAGHLKQASKMLEHVSDSIKQKSFTPNLNKNNCASCDFKALCRYV